MARLIDREKVINDLNMSVCMLCNPEMLTPEMRIRIGQAINSATKLLEEQEPVKPDYSPYYQEWYCGNCGKIIPRAYNYCNYCGKAVEWN